MNDFLFAIFVENAGDAFVLPLLTSLTWEAMLAFGAYAMALPTLAALAGALPAALADWGIGRLLARLREKRPEALSGAHYALAQRYARFPLLFLLPMALILPLGPIILVVAGFFRVPAKKAAFLALLGYAAWLGMLTVIKM